MHAVAKPTKGKIVVLSLLTGMVTLLHFLVPTDQYTFHVLQNISKSEEFLFSVISNALIPNIATWGGV